MTKFSKEEYAELLLNTPAEHVGYTLYNDLLSASNNLYFEILVAIDVFKSKSEDEEVLTFLNLAKQRSEDLFEIIYGYHQYLYKPDN